MKVFNTALASNPFNWIKVNVMALTGFIALFLIVRLFTPQATEE